MRRRALLALATSLLTAGCAAVGPHYKLPETAMVNAPAAQRPFMSGGDAVTAEPLPDHWWKLYDDPRLDDLVERALSKQRHQCVNSLVAIGGAARRRDR